MGLSAHKSRDSTSQKRSRSPRDSGRHQDVKRQRSRSPYRRSHHHHHHRSKPSPDVRLPFHARPLHKRDFEEYKATFAEYLELQKQLDIHGLSEDEVKGRWKSFLNKWNNGGELAEGWYDPETKSKADARFVSRPPVYPARRRPAAQEQTQAVSEDEGEDDGYGPALPSTAGRRVGPAVASLQDLRQNRELAEEDRDARIADIRYERKQDRKAQKERLEELAPRAELGSRERQLEKKRENAAANRSFRDAKEGGGVEEVAESELMGDDVDSFKAQTKAKERQKNEREIKKEEVMRARAAEREERMAEHRAKEDKTMEMLSAIAKQRFG